MDFVLVTCFFLEAIICAFQIKGKLPRGIILVLGLIWVSLSYLSITNPFRLHRVSLLTNIIILSGFGMILLGYTVYRPRRTKGYTIHTNIIRNLIRVCEIKKLRVLYLISFAIILYLAITQWRIIILQAGLGNLKLDFFELVFEGNHVLFFIYQTLLCPLFYLSCLLLSLLVFEKRWNVTTLVIASYVILFCFIGGKRGYFSIVIMSFLVSYLIVRYTRFNKGKRRRLPFKALATIGIIMGLGASLITAVGSSGTEAEKDDIYEAINNLAENVFVYQIGSFRAFETSVEKNFVQKNGGYLYGRATIGGAIDYYGSSILNALGVPIKSARAVAMSPIQNNSIQIGKEREWNFSYTGFYYFWCDAGFLGIFLFSFLFGAFVRFSVGLFESSGTIGSMTLLFYMFYACQLMTGTWVNVELYTQPAVAIFLLLHRMELKIRRNEISKKNQDSLQYT